MENLHGCDTVLDSHDILHITRMRCWQVDIAPCARTQTLCEHMGEEDQRGRAQAPRQAQHRNLCPHRPAPDGACHLDVLRHAVTSSSLVSRGDQPIREVRASCSPSRPNYKRNLNYELGN